MVNARGDSGSNDLRALETWAGALLTMLQPTQRRAINHQVAIDLRRSQAQRIKAQQGPDGAAYAARKTRKQLKSKKERIKRQKGAIFNKLRTAKSLKAEADAGQLTIGFVGKVTRVARVHHKGRTDKVAKNGPKYTYPARPLLGISEADRTLIRESLLNHLLRA